MARVKELLNEKYGLLQQKTKLMRKQHRSLKDRYEIMEIDRQLNMIDLSFSAFMGVKVKLLGDNDE